MERLRLRVQRLRKGRNKKLCTLEVQQQRMKRERKHVNYKRQQGIPQQKRNVLIKMHTGSTGLKLAQ